MVYIVFYIHTDNPEYSEILGAFNDKDDAVDELLVRANYREIKGKLTQYYKPCKEYESFSLLRTKVSTNMELVDTDVYRISKIPLL